MLAVVGVLFLIIQFVALVIGFVLARQITGAVHDLFTGTQHLRNRNFAHQIPVRARDQLGELAESFNVMTGEVTTLLGEIAEKGRMEQEMFAAREIQQKLLPSGPLQRAGPGRHGVLRTGARGGGRLLRLPADHRHDARRADRRRRRARACRRPLHGAAEGDRAVAGAPASRADASSSSRSTGSSPTNLDAKSFITMSYGVIDLERREMTFARAGHCPLIHVPGNAAGRAAQGAHAGARRPRRRPARSTTATMFDAMLQEQTIPLAPGDLIVFFTDGISETMNEAFDCFGEARLAQGARAVRAPAVRSAALVHPRRAARLRRRAPISTTT